MYITRKVIKGSADADHLADNVVEDYKFLKLDFPDKDVMALSKDSNNGESNDKWKMCFNGVMNLSRKGIKAIIVSFEGK